MKYSPLPLLILFTVLSFGYAFESYSCSELNGSETPTCVNRSDFDSQDAYCKAAYGDSVKATLSQLGCVEKIPVVVHICGTDLDGNEICPDEATKDLSPDAKCKRYSGAEFHVDDSGEFCIVAVTPYTICDNGCGEPLTTTSEFCDLQGKEFIELGGESWCGENYSIQVKELNLWQRMLESAFSDVLGVAIVALAGLLGGYLISKKQQLNKKETLTKANTEEKQEDLDYP